MGSNIYPNKSPVYYIKSESKYIIIIKPCKQEKNFYVKALPIPLSKAPAKAPMGRREVVA
ncbi:hypothetical protein Scep_021932 [Stephania cephalantha]|uniref:Uncharacterized protein n=1 Tax=Stephania cephalantha TaxID=152367 RepID=A0AAP0HX94_9MAGN